MINKRMTALLASKDVGSAGTEVIDININDQISRIVVNFEFTIVTVSLLKANPREAIRLIEILDGSKIIKSLTGQEASGMGFLTNNKPPFSKYSLTVGGKCKMSYNLDFGRYLWDTELALRPEMFSNLQMRITYDEDYANTSVVVNSLSVYAWVFSAESGKNAIGYLRAIRHQAYTREASSHKYINLPVDHPIRKLVIFGGMTNVAVDTSIDNLKLSVNGDAEVPYDVDGTHLAEMLGMDETFAQNIDLDDAVTAKDIFSDFGKENHIAIAYDDTAHVTAQTKFAEQSAPAGSLIDLAASVDIKAVRAIVTGRLPFNCLPFGFGDDWNPDTWMKPSQADNVRLDILASASSPTITEVSVIVEQFVRY